jgi:hypothetical protein
MIMVDSKPKKVQQMEVTSLGPRYHAILNVLQRSLVGFEIF